MNCRGGRIGAKLDPCFPSSELRSAASHRGNLIRGNDGLYPAITSLQGLEFREMAPQIDFTHHYRNLRPVQYPAMVRMLDQGVHAYYIRGVGKVPSARGLPYNLTNADHSMLISGKFWKDICDRRIFCVFDCHRE